MKTIFTILFSMAMFSTTFAQYGQRDKDRGNDNNVYASNDNRGFDRHTKGYCGYLFTPRERDMQISEINGVYEYRIQSVKHKPYMGWYQKKRLINNLEAQRDEEIGQVIRKFRSAENMFDNHGRKDKKRW